MHPGRGVRPCSCGRDVGEFGRYVPLCPFHLHGVTGKLRGEERAEKLGHAFMYGCDESWFGIHLPPPPDSDEAELESYMRARERFEESRCRAFVADLVAQHQR